ncbi:MAG TPA: outer membrane beta-barrel protein [Candidatus Limnocylindrales bacterium]|nr:outer membrane beta-barrel protein [Candidatus Limnocylindrales bacterium]
MNNVQLFTRDEAPRAAGFRGALLVTLFVAAFVLPLVPAPSPAAEIIPSYGITKSTDSDQAKGMFGLALRGTLVPNLLQSEIAGGYRTESQSNGALNVRQWPISASLLLAPANLFYAGAGVGWYHTTYDYKSDLIQDETTQDFGVHIAGGLKIPLSPHIAADLDGRYVFLQDQQSRLIPEKFNPSFWTLSAGLALKL